MMNLVIILKIKKLLSESVGKYVSVLLKLDSIHL